MVIHQSSNYIFKVAVTHTVEVTGGDDKPERTAWADVATPVITSAVQDGANVNCNSRCISWLQWS